MNRWLTLEDLFDRAGQQAGIAFDLEQPLLGFQSRGITRQRDNGKDLTSAKSDLWVGDDGYRPKRILATKRIGINKAAEMPLRYIIAANPFVSR